MEADRRLAAVATDAEVDELAAEWTDRYGEPPAPAAALLAVARLRVALLMRGIRGVSVQKDVARFEGWELKKSQEIRLQRVSARAKVVDDIVTVPFVAGAARQGIGVVEALLGLLGEIAPVDPAPVASPAP
jgi:transcription-repair coupling factor (superfamily II helicase)